MRRWKSVDHGARAASPLLGLASGLSALSPVVGLEVPPGAGVLIVRAALPAADGHHAVDTGIIYALPNPRRRLNSGWLEWRIER